MKKNIILIALIAVSALSAQAQLKFGIKAGVNFANVSGDVAETLKTENMTGFQVGPTVEFIVPVVGFGLDASLLYSQEGFKTPAISFSGVKVTDAKTYSTNSLLIPVNLKYKFSILVAGAYLSAGPYAQFNFDNFSEQIESKSFGAGLNFGLGVELLSHLQIGANYQLGLTNNFGDFKAAGVTVGELEGKTKVWSLTATYFF